MNRLFFFFVLGTLSFSLSAQSGNGGEDLQTLWNAELLGTGTQITSGQSVFSDLLNPAASGDLQRVTVNMGYTGILGFSNLNQGWKGHAGGLGLSLPTRFGVLTTSGQFSTSSLPDFTSWSSGGFSLSFAKDLYRDFLIGAGLSAGLGSQPQGTLNWSAGLSLGFIHIIEDLGGLKDFRWGLSLRNMGKALDTVPNSLGYPTMFTLGAGSEFLLIKDKDFQWKILNEISFPTFLNVRGTLGTQVQIGDFFTLASAVQVDGASLMEGSSRALIPSLSLQFHIRSDLKDKNFFGLEETEFKESQWSPALAASFLKTDIVALGFSNRVALGVVDTAPPQITLTADPVLYVSPNNDGKKDALILPIRISDERYIQSYRLDIKNGDGVVVRSLQNKDPRPENQDQIQDFMSRLLYAKEGIPVPETLRWDGYTDEGSLAPDGTYTYQLMALDDNLNEGSSRVLEVVVDTQAPALFLNPVSGAELIFSPDDDGNKDSLTLIQTGSREDLWLMEVTNTLGAVVRKWTQAQAELQKVTWDGKDDLGQIVPDGVYNYRVSSVDRADNLTSASVGNMIVNTQLTPIALTLEYAQFSPNGNNLRDQLPLLAQIPVKDGIRTWKLEILDSADKVVAKFENTTGELPPVPYLFDGKSETGRVLSDGNYRAQLSLSYIKGNSPQAVSPEFTLDTTAPQATVLIEGLAVFSPGEGSRTELPLIQTTSAEELWEGTVVRSQALNVPVKTWKWTAEAPKKLLWNGTNDQGRLVDDGDFIYILKSTDRAGNSFETKTPVFKLDTKERKAILTAQGRAFSPNGDGSMDRIALFPQTNLLEGLQNNVVVILNDQKTPVRSFRGTRTLPENVSWDGLDDAGKRAPEGNYSAQLTLTYENGQTTQAASAPFILDITAPTVEVTAPYSVFSPNGDGKKDVFTLVQKSSENPLWVGVVKNDKNAVVRTMNWSGLLKPWEWDGKNEAGNLVSDGVFSYEVQGVDEAGNQTIVHLKNIQVDSRPISLFVTLDKTMFSPGKTDGLGEIQFNILPSIKQNISQWTLGVYHKEKGLQKEYTGTQAIPEKITWNGVGVSGALEGTYYATVDIEYLKGDTPSATTVDFLLDRSAPLAKVDLNPEYFSPDNDGVDDELTIRLNATDSAGIASWSLDIQDPSGKLFRRFDGKGQPSKQILWDGRSSSGEVVQSAVDYPYLLSLTDVLGNTSQFKGAIPIDILVIRDGDRLKILIPSITFSPNSPMLLNDASEASKKNLAILDRIAQILNRFSRHQVRIEGHAVRIFWNDPVKGKEEEDKELLPLSLDRAKTVRKALIERSVDGSRLTTAGLGGTEPVIPHSDLENRWKNRRVEFILVR